MLPITEKTKDFVEQIFKYLQCDKNWKLLQDESNVKITTLILLVF